MTTKPVGIPNGSRRLEFDRLIQIETDRCVEWPFSRNTKGYGLLWVDGKCHTTHALVCESHNGPRPKGYHAAHRCGNEACLNYRHIRWATPKENEADKRLHGTYNGGPRNRRKTRPMTCLDADGNLLEAS